MADGASALSWTQLRRLRVSDPGATPWVPTWSKPAALRAVRTTLVMPTLFVICDQVIGNLQMATFAAFGSFATLVLASFTGTRRDKLIAHALLALAGSVLLMIGTAVNSSTALAALVTVPVAFAVFFAGIAGPNAASGVTAAMLAYVLPAASPGTFSMVPDRLAGWWLASVAGTLAVLTLSPPAPANRLREAAASLTSALADQLEAMLRGDASEARLSDAIAAKHELLARFTSTPFRPTGLASTDQGLANAAELLQWCTSLVADTFHEQTDMHAATSADRELVAAAAALLREAAPVLGGTTRSRLDLGPLEAARARSRAELQQLPADHDCFRIQARVSFHAHAISVTVLRIAAEATVAAGLEDAPWVAEQAGRWYGVAMPTRRGGRLAVVSRLAGIAWHNASVRSVWFVNSLRGALALAAAVAVADVISVQHGFWVVLGTLSVLRTNASSTGSTALRALLGTGIGFVIGWALLLVIGTSSPVLWAVLPIAVFVAAYAPGTAPFALGQAAFTVTIAVLFNLLAPIGWRVGVIRIEDVAIGCAVSLVVGALFWPRGVASVVGNDLADAYRAGAAYLTEAIEWVCGIRTRAPEGAAAAVTAGFRLDDALRGLLAEQGTKHVSRETLWRLVGGTLRLRLTAHAVATLPRHDEDAIGPARLAITRRAESLNAWFQRLAAEVGTPRGGAHEPLEPPPLDHEAENDADSQPAIWLCEHLDHLTEHLGELVGAAEQVAEIRRRPWWR